MSTNRNINDIIVDKIHASFIELVPEEELREIVAKAIDDFKAPRITKANYGSQGEAKPSPLEEVVGKAINELLTKAVNKHLDEALQTKFDEYGQRIASEAITNAVEQAAPVILQHFVKTAGEWAAIRMTESLRSQLRNGGLQI